eukprot:COSAG01_NODE_4545_length_4932_cov_102.732671_3_plen_81_part_00
MTIPVEFSHDSPHATVTDRSVRWIDFSEGRRPAPEGFRREYGRLAPLWQTGCVGGTAEVMGGGFRVRSPDHGYQGWRDLL